MNPADLTTQSFGGLKISVTAEQTYAPIPDATVSISYAGQVNAIEQLTTDNSGQTEIIELEAPPVEYSLDPEAAQPYSTGIRDCHY